MAFLLLLELKEACDDRQRCGNLLNICKNFVWNADECTHEVKLNLRLEPLTFCRFSVLFGSFVFPLSR